MRFPRVLRHPNEGGGTTDPGGEGDGKGKTQSTEVKIREMTPEEFLAKHPEFKQRLDAGDAAVAATRKAAEDKAVKDGEFQKLLDTEKDEHTKTRTKAQTLEAENRALKRATEIRDHLDAAKDLKYPALAIKEIAKTLDDGKMSVEELVKKSVEKLEAMGLAPAQQKTDGLGGGGSGGGGDGGQGSDTDQKIAELVELGAKARKTNKPQDLRAYEDMRTKLKSEGIKLPLDLPQRIDKAASKAA